MKILVNFKEAHKYQLHAEPSIKKVQEATAGLSWALFKQVAFSLTIYIVPAYVL